MKYLRQKACGKCDRNKFLKHHEILKKGWDAKSLEIALTKVKMLTTYLKPLNNTLKKKSNQRYPESK